MDTRKIDLFFRKNYGKFKKYHKALIQIKLTEAPEEKTERFLMADFHSPFMSLILAIFTSIFGIDVFYNRKIFFGIIKLAVSVTFFYFYIVTKSSIDFNLIKNGINFNDLNNKQKFNAYMCLGSFLLGLLFWLISILLSYRFTKSYNFKKFKFLNNLQIINA